MTRPQSSAFPVNPWTPTFLIASALASVIASVIVVAKHGQVNAVSVVIPLVSALLAVLAWNRFTSSRLQGSTPQASPAMAYVLLAGSFVVAAVGLAMQTVTAGEWFTLVVPYVLIVLYQTSLWKSHTALLWIAPLLFGSIFLTSAAILGNISLGGFPAVLATLLSFIVYSTHELEYRTEFPIESDGDPHVHLVHRRPLAWISIVFFLFGVICFWPWLGKIYGDAYFWVMVIGVLAPLLYFWGRLRQPRRQNSLSALLRFNNLIPYIGLVLLVAIALG